MGAPDACHTTGSRAGGLHRGGRAFKLRVMPPNAQRLFLCGALGADKRGKPSTPVRFTGENFRKVTAQAKWNDLNVAERKGDLPMTDAKKKDRPARCPDCVTEVRRGNTVLVFSGYFKEGATATAADKMLKVLEAESAAGHKPPFTA